jgi:transposase
MIRNDARKDSLGVKHERRKQVVRMHLQGKGPMEIAALCGLSWPTVRRAIDLYEQGGWKAIKHKVGGKRKGQGRRLSADQERALRRMICEKRPEQLKLDFALWTRIAVNELIQREYGLTLSVRSVGNYLQRWGFTPQKPIKRAYERNPAHIRRWMKEEFPAIARRARSAGGAVHWCDETAIVNTDVRGRSYSPEGRTPVAYAPGARQKLSMISTVTNKGEAHWQIIDGNFNADRLIEFLEHLLRSTPKKVFLVLDNLRTHHCKPVKEWFALHAHRIEAFYLPSYAPELNPDERLNASLKHAIRSKVPERTKAKLKHAAEAHMTDVAENPELVKSFFQDPAVNYAA